MPPENPPVPNPNEPSADDIKKENAALKAELEKLKAKPPTPEPPKPPSDEPDLKEKARREVEEKEKRDSDRRSLEGSIRFNMGIKDYMKLNGSLLPKDAQAIFDTAEKEKYDSEVDKTRSIKSALIQSFFGVQSNVDHLTESQKQKLDEYLKLTKNMKHDRAEEFYDSVLEPTLENVRKMRKAQAIAKGMDYDGDDAMKEKMRKSGLRHYNVKERNSDA